MTTPIDLTILPRNRELVEYLCEDAEKLIEVYSALSSIYLGNTAHNDDAELHKKFNLAYEELCIAYAPKSDDRFWSSYRMIELRMPGWKKRAKTLESEFPDKWAENQMPDDFSHQLKD